MKKKRGIKQLQTKNKAGSRKRTLIELIEGIKLLDSEEGLIDISS